MVGYRYLVSCYSTQQLIGLKQARSPLDWIAGSVYYCLQLG